MKSKTFKRVVAAAMAAMLAITAVPAPDVQAAAKPKLSVAKKTMTEGQKLTLTVKNKPAKATLTWKTSNKKVATVTKKGVVKAVKKGTANVTVKVKTKTRTYNLKCKITVKSKPSQTVSTQSALNTALKDKDVTTITLKTTAAKKFTIAAGNYTKKTLVVDAANADVVNSGKFKEIKIKNIKPETFTEKAKGNKITVSAKKARVVAEKGAEVSSVSMTGKNADVKVIIKADAAVGTVTINGADAKVDVTADGAVSKVEVAKAAEVRVSGTTKDIPVSVTADAAGTKLTAETPVKVEAAAKADVTLEKGAEGSTVTETAASAEVKVANNTTAKVTVTDSAGKTTDVAAGKTETVTTPTQPTTPTTPTEPTTPTQPTTPSTPSGPSTPSTTEKWELKYVDADIYANILARAGSDGTNQPALTDFADNFSIIRDTAESMVIEHYCYAAGTLNYVEGYTAFSSDTEMQAGYYIHTMVEIPADVDTTTGGAFIITENYATSNEKYVGEEALTTVNGKKYYCFVRRVTSKNDHFGFTIRWGTGEYEIEYYDINFESVTFRPAARDTVLGNGISYAAADVVGNLGCAGALSAANALGTNMAAARKADEMFYL